jgi:hypothetical protein
MFKTQMNYWNDMMEKIQENYKASLTSGQGYQDNFSGFLREMVENNYRTMMDYQNELQGITRKMIGSSMDDMNQLSKLYTDNLEYVNKAVNSVAQKYNVNNDEFKNELEQIWKENTEAFRKRLDETIKTVNNTQQKNIDLILDVYKNFSEKSIQELNKRMESISKSR